MGTQEGIKVPICVIVAFKQNNRQNSQTLNNDSFYTPPATSAQWIFGTENYPDSGILINYDDDHYSQGNDQVKEAIRAPTQEDVLNPYISDHFLDQLTLMLLVKLQMILVIIITFSIDDIRKIKKLLNQFN